MIRCVVFDFDGTLVLSNDIKHEGFFIIAREFSGGADKMERILSSNLFGTRYDIFHQFCTEEYSGNDTLIANLVRRYTEWCEEMIVNCPERAGAGDVLTELRQSAISLHISSATPVEALRSIVHRRFPEGLFDSIHGAPEKKGDALRTIMALHRVSPHEVVMVGDGMEDYQAANEVGCKFAGIGEGTLSKIDYRGPLITDLTRLPEVLFRHEENKERLV